MKTWLIIGIFVAIMLLGAGYLYKEEIQLRMIDVKPTWDHWTNKRILTLHPKVRVYAAGFINAVEEILGIQLRISSAHRSFEEQRGLYARGRTTGGSIVTYAKPGQSYHNYGLAIDVVEITEDGKVNYDLPWDKISDIAAGWGWEWGGHWSKPDKPHFQMSFGKHHTELLALYESQNNPEFLNLV